MHAEKIPPAPSRVTIRDVARAAGVAVGTVSNLLNAPDRVTPDKRRRIEAAIQELGYVRNVGAATTRAGRSAARTIGLVVVDVANPFFTEVTRGAEDAANAAGRLVILCNSDSDSSKERRYLQVLEEQRVLGALISPVASDRRRLVSLRERGMAVVLLERQHRGFCSVTVDSVQGGDQAVSHLLDLGHRHIAFVSSRLSVPQFSNRLKGAREACRRAGFNPDTVLVHLESPHLDGRSVGRQAARRILDEQLPVTAVFAAADLIALGLINELMSSGLSVPGDISVVGYDDIADAAHAPVPLTTVRQPMRELGRLGNELLIAEATDLRHRHRQHVLGTELIVRGTTATPATAR
ncbi:LacI family DNA-binding transcriptional regulator [Streptomyces sp. WAC 06738]|uniref:LacI family DNA-binding transcriptional regulator n=1 Tax=Streptomyces sp. WAC 06738 TaxID=2203210 RepID=UPI0019D292C8|nr:LacI family DNA-binding transcriptional regulator [Streptomyces sp. WAC 06738]